MEDAAVRFGFSRCCRSWSTTSSSRAPRRNWTNGALSGRFRGEGDRMDGRAVAATSHALRPGPIPGQVGRDGDGRWVRKAI